MSGNRRTGSGTGRLIKAGIPAEENKKLDTRSMHFVLTQMMSMADAMEAPTEKCPLEESIGRISAEFAYLYPPGIPLITPGEQITGQFTRNMRIYMDKGYICRDWKTIQIRRSLW